MTVTIEGIGSLTNPVVRRRLDGVRTGRRHGAASGIGRATALRLASEGWTVSLLDRDAERLAATAEDVRAGSRGGDAVRDLLSWTSRTPHTPTRWPASTCGPGRRPAGEQRRRGLPGGGRGDVTDEQWDLTLAVNLSAMFLPAGRCCRG